MTDQPNVDALIEEATERGVLRKELADERAKNRELEAALGRTRQALNLAEQIEGARVTPPRWTRTKGKGKHPAMPVLMLTDTHFEEVVRPEEVFYLNAYSRSIAFSRLERAFQGAARVCQDYVAGHTFEGFVLLLGGDMYCFPKGTPITLEDGTVLPVEELRPGARVASKDGFGEVTQTHKRPATRRDALRRVRAIKGTDLLGTPEHMVAILPREAVETGWNPGGKRARGFVVRDKTGITERDVQWVPLGEVRPGDYLLSQAWRPTDGPETLNIAEVTGLDLGFDGTHLQRKVRGWSPRVVSAPEVELSNQLLRLLGLYVAEGHSVRGRSGHTNSIVFTFHKDENDHHQEILDGMKEIFGVEARLRPGPNSSVKQVHVNNQIVATFFVSLCGHKAEGKTIKEPLWRAGRSLLPLVQGWLDGDGGYGSKHEQGPNNIAGKTVSPSLAQQLVTICFSEGLDVGHSVQPHGRWFPAHVILFTGTSAQRIASGSIKYDPLVFKPTYEDGLWIESWYAHRVVAVYEETIQEGDPLYDLTITPTPAYQASGYVVHNSGDIHLDARETNEGTLVEGLVYWLEPMLAGIRMLADEFGRVHIAGVVGNHTRRTRQPRYKLRAIDNYDWLYYQLLARELKNDDRVTLQIPESADCIVPIFDTRLLLTHGDQFSGGSGISAMLSPLMLGDHRKLKKHVAASRYGGEDVNYDLMLCGHWHQRMIYDRIVVSGALKGYDEYAFLKNFSYAPASQELVVFAPQHGPILHAPIFVQRRDLEGW